MTEVTRPEYERPHVLRESIKDFKSVFLNQVYTNDYTVPLFLPRTTVMVRVERQYKFPSVPIRLILSYNFKWLNTILWIPFYSDESPLFLYENMFSYIFCKIQPPFRDGNVTCHRVDPDTQSVTNKNTWVVGLLGRIILCKGSTHT